MRQLLVDGLKKTFISRSKDTNYDRNPDDVIDEVAQLLAKNIYDYCEKRLSISVATDDSENGDTTVDSPVKDAVSQGINSDDYISKKQDSDVSILVNWINGFKIGGNLINNLLKS